MLTFTCDKSQFKQTFRKKLYSLCEKNVSSSIPIFNLLDFKRSQCHPDGLSWIYCVAYAEPL